MGTTNWSVAPPWRNKVEIVGHGGVLSEERERLLVDGLVLRAPMAHLDHGHAGTGEVEELALHLLEHVERERAGAGAEVADPRRPVVAQTADTWIDVAQRFQGRDQVGAHLADDVDGRDSRVPPLEDTVLHLLDVQVTAPKDVEDARCAPPHGRVDVRVPSRRGQVHAVEDLASAIGLDDLTTSSATAFWAWAVDAPM